MPVIARNPATRNSEANILVYPGSPADSPDRSTLPCAPKFFVLLVVVATHHNSRPFITKGVLKVQRCARRNAKTLSYRMPAATKSTDQCRRHRIPKMLTGNRGCHHPETITGWHTHVCNRFLST